MSLNKSGTKQSRFIKEFKSKYSSTPSSSTSDEDDPDYEYPGKITEPREEYSEGSNSSTESQVDLSPDKQLVTKKKGLHKPNKKNQLNTKQLTSKPGKPNEETLIEHSSNSPINEKSIMTNDHYESLDQRTLSMLKQAASKTVVKLKPMMVKSIRKRALIDRIEKSLNNQQALNNLKVNINAVVTPPYQERMNESLNNAVWVFQSTIMKEMISIRQQELKDIQIEIKDVKEQWNAYKHNYVCQMFDMGIEVSEKTLAEAKQYLEHSIDEQDRQIKHDHVVRTISNREKDDTEKLNRAEKQVEETLGNQPTSAFERLEKVVLRLSEDVAILKGNDGAKPTHTLNRKKVGGGNKKANTQKKRSSPNITAKRKIEKGKDRDNVNVLEKMSSRKPNRKKNRQESTNDPVENKRI